MSSIADLYFSFRGDDKELVVDAQKGGDKAAKTLAERLGQANFSKAGAAIGALGGAALALGDKYAAATNTLITETGAAGDELEALKSTAAEVAGQVPQGIDQVAVAVSRVSTRLKLEGDDLAKVSKLALDFARVHKIDVATAVDLVDDALDRMGLSADQAAPLLDKVTVAGREAGVAAESLLTGLADAGPTLRNLGFGLDESIALLASYTGAGGDAAEISGALNKAVVKFADEGATDAREALGLLVEKVKEAPDNLTAATIASEIFGSKVGAKLVPAMRDGTFNVDLLTAALQDSDGAFEDVSERTKTWGDRIGEVLNQVGAFVGPLVGQFGELGFAAAGISKSIPLIAGALGAAAPKIAGILANGLARSTAIADGLVTNIGRIPGLSNVKSVLGSVGNSLGSTLGKAVGITAAAAIAFWIADDIVKQRATWKQLGEDAAAAVAEGNLEALKAEHDRLNAAINDLVAPHGFDPLLPFKTFFSQDEVDQLFERLQQVDAAIAALETSARKNFEETGAAAQQAAVKVDASALGMQASLFLLGPAGRRAGAEASLGIAEGLRDKRAQIKAAVAQLRESLEHALRPTKEIGEDVGLLLGKAITHGLKSADPAAKAQAEGTRALVEARLLELIAAGGKIGEKTLEELASKMKSKDPVVREQARRTQELVDSALKRQPPRTPGELIANQLASDLRDAGPVIGRIMYAIGRQLVANLRAGVNGSGLVGGGGAVHNSGGGPVVGGSGYAEGTSYVPFDQLALVHRGEMVIPADDSARIRAGFESIGGGNTYGDQVVNLHMPDAANRDPFEVLDRVARYQRWGRLNPRPAG